MPSQNLRTPCPPRTGLLRGRWGVFELCRALSMRQVNMPVPAVVKVERDNEADRRRRRRSRSRPHPGWDRRRARGGRTLPGRVRPRAMARGQLGGCCFESRTTSARVLSCSSAGGSLPWRSTCTTGPNTRCSKGGESKPRVVNVERIERHLAKALSESKGSGAGWMSRGSRSRRAARR